MIITNPSELTELDLTSTDPLVYHIYFLWESDEIVYIGQTTNIKNRISAHKADKLFDRVTYTVLDLVDIKDVLALERKNINYYKPIFNDNKNVLLKRANYCFLRDGSKSLYLKANELIQDRNQGLCYYNGSIYCSIKKGYDGYNIYEDLNLIRVYNPDKYEDITFKVVDSKLEIISTLRTRTNTGKTLASNSIIPFGKYKGQTVSYVFRTDFPYIQWLVTKWEGSISKQLKEDINHRVDKINNRL